MTELIQRPRFSDPQVDTQLSDDGSACIVWRHEDVTHSLTLLTTEQDPSAAIIGIGRGCRDELWQEEAGLNLLLVHIDEVVATRDTSQPLRVSSTGLVWPKPRLVSDLPAGRSGLEWTDNPKAELDAT